eukprot:421987-Prymnesium_polylepis.1
MSHFLEVPRRLWRRAARALGGGRSRIDEFGGSSQAACALNVEQGRKHHAHFPSTGGQRPGLTFGW